MQQSRLSILRATRHPSYRIATTKDTKSTKVWDARLRALRVFRGFKNLKEETDERQ